MILYNVTVNIDHSISEEWLVWMKTVHIPDVMATGCFIENKMCRIRAEEEGGKSFSIQYLAASEADYKHYESNFAAKLQADFSQRYRGQFAAFRTLLEVVHHQTA